MDEIAKTLHDTWQPKPQKKIMAKNAPMMQKQDPAGFHFDVYRSENIRKASLPINF